MSQDIVADTLNQMMNAKKAGKESIVITRSSKFLQSVLAMGKVRGYIKSYKAKDKGLEIEFGDKFNACKAVKPRYIVKTKDIQKYVNRYLPARDMGIVIVSTSQGLMTHQAAQDKKIGGSVIAYFY